MVLEKVRTGSLSIMIKTILSSLFLFFIVFANAQETEQGEEEKEKRHSIAVLISHTQVAETVEGEGKKSISVPSWGIDYNFGITEQWAVGLHNDIIVESFVIENSEGT